MLEKLFNLAMGVERSEFLGAEPYERTSQRRGHANGYKDKKISTRVGELRLKIPQVRGLSFYPQSLEKGCRPEIGALRASDSALFFSESSRGRPLPEAALREAADLSPGRTAPSANGVGRGRRRWGPER